MSPIMPCPYCGNDTNFHEDEVDGVKHGSTVCLACGLEMEKAVFILEMAAGEHPQLIPDEQEEEE